MMARSSSWRSIECWVVLYGARSWSQWLLWFTSNLHSMILMCLNPSTEIISKIVKNLHWFECHIWSVSVRNTARRELCCSSSYSQSEVGIQKIYTLGFISYAFVWVLYRYLFTCKLVIMDFPYGEEGKQSISWHWSVAADLPQIPDLDWDKPFSRITFLILLGTWKGPEVVAQNELQLIDINTYFWH